MADRAVSGMDRRNHAAVAGGVGEVTAGRIRRSVPAPIVADVRPVGLVAAP